MQNNTHRLMFYIDVEHLSGRQSVENTAKALTKALANQLFDSYKITGAKFCQNVSADYRQEDGTLREFMR